VISLAVPGFPISFEYSGGHSIATFRLDIPIEFGVVSDRSYVTGKNLRELRIETTSGKQVSYYP
jgi:hypothetical protein